MGAQLIMAYMTKEEDIKTASGHKDVSTTQPKPPGLWRRPVVHSEIYC
jgi:hypothetical protein